MALEKILLDMFAAQGAFPGADPQKGELIAQSLRVQNDLQYLLSINFPCQYLWGKIGVEYMFAQECC